MFLRIKIEFTFPKGTDAFGNTRIFTAAASSLDNANESEEDYFEEDESNAVSNNNDVLDIGVSEPRNPPPSIADKRRPPPPRPQQTIEPFAGPQPEHRLVGLSVDEIYNAGTTLSNDKQFTTLQSLCIECQTRSARGFRLFLCVLRETRFIMDFRGKFE